MRGTRGIDERLPQPFGDPGRVIGVLGGFPVDPPSGAVYMHRVPRRVCVRHQEKTAEVTRRPKHDVVRCRHDRGEYERRRFVFPEENSRLG